MRKSIVFGMLVVCQFNKDTNLMFIILNLGLPPTYPTIMANDFEAGPSHTNYDINDGKFYIIYL